MLFTRRTIALVILLSADGVLAIPIMALAEVANQSQTQQANPPSAEPLIGVGVALSPAAKGVQVSQVLPNRPADLSGEIQPGDLIVAIQNEADETGPISMNGLKLDEATAKIHGPAGSVVLLTIIPKDARFVTKKIVRLTRVSLRNTELLGKKVPALVMKDLSGGLSRDLASFQGKVVIVDFWSTTCIACAENINDLKTLPENNPAWEDKVAIVTVSVDELLDSAREFIESQAWDFSTNLWGGEAAKNDFAADLIPLLIVVDQTGTIAAIGDPSTMNIPRIVDGLLPREE